MSADVKTQPALFQRDPQETSVLAAVTVDTRSQQERVAEFLEQCSAHGATDEEGKEAVGVVRYRTRRKALVDQGLVVDSGRRRKTSFGKDAIVWVWTAASIRRQIVRTPSQRTLQQQEAERVARIGEIPTTSRGNLAVKNRAADSLSRARGTRRASSTGRTITHEDRVRAHQKIHEEREREKRAAASASA